MDVDTARLAFAWFAILLAMFTFLFRMIKPGFFRKLAMMQKAFGSVPGYLMHFFAYTIVPLVIGIVLLWSQQQQAAQAL